MPKRSRAGFDEASSSRPRRPRTTEASSSIASGSFDLQRFPMDAYSPSSQHRQPQQNLGFPDFDAAIALDLEDDGCGQCLPSGSGSRPETLPRTLDERFVPGLQTFVGGLSMSRPVNQQATGADRERAQPRSNGFDRAPIVPPPLVMSRRSQSGSRSSPPPRPSLDGTVRLSTHGGFAAPPSAPLVPGVSPGWHVESQGLRAMGLHEGVRYQDEDGWTPLDAFPARTEAGKAAARKARLHLRLLFASTSSFEQAPTSNRDVMSIPTASKASPPTAPSCGEIYSEASTSKLPLTKALRDEEPPMLPPLSAIHANSIVDDSFTLSPIEDPMTASQIYQQEYRRKSGQSPKTLSASPTHKRPAVPVPEAPQIWFLHGMPQMGPRPTDPTSARVEDGQPTRIGSQPSAAKAASLHPQYSPRDFEVLETLGSGTFGRVLLVRLKSKEASDPSAYFALKVLSKSKVVHLKQIEHTNSERAILAKVQHPFLVNLITTFQDSKNCYMLMDYVIGGEIFSYLRRSGRFSVDVARFYISTIVLAIEYLHDRNIIYRDLKPENLLLDGRGYTKITDFGFAKEVEGRTWTLCGTPEYLAPEIIQSKGHGKAVDWWALGILLFEMLAGYPPFHSTQPIGVYESILQGQIVFPPHIDEVSRDLIRSLLTADRSRRLGNLRGGAQDVKNHRWFHGVDWAELEKGNIRPPIIPFNARAGDTCNFSKYDRVRLSSLPGFSDELPLDPDEAMAMATDPYAGLFPSF